MTRYLVVPGRGVPLPDHWSRRWVSSDPKYRWAPEPPGPPFVVTERVAALHAAISADSEPVILVAHSAGCLTVAVWASQHVGPVRAALLVTPPYLDPDWTAEPDETVDVFIGHVPREPLPFRSILVASRNDPHATFAQFEAYARDWGSELFDAGAVGHLDSKTGFGPWPDGQRLVRSLTVPPSHDGSAGT
ncbi:RBBP9/YdeN family alpha/beta hydrolase [Micromonospora endophytica]|uniref:RBBP9/YdeN family alpha/beta hydrolase n=1 Tax=Micromonospora endophytica TaxID=515350 RepID=UPI0015E8C5A4|nr:alpha/beta hydrolase [Micromonospora endophytica]